MLYFGSVIHLTLLFIHFSSLAIGTAQFFYPRDIYLVFMGGCLVILVGGFGMYLVCFWK